MLATSATDLLILIVPKFSVLGKRPDEGLTEQRSHMQPYTTIAYSSSHHLAGNGYEYHLPVPAQRPGRRLEWYGVTGRKDLARIGI